MASPFGRLGCQVCKMGGFGRYRGTGTMGGVPTSMAAGRLPAFSTDTRRAAATAHPTEFATKNHGAADHDWVLTG